MDCAEGEEANYPPNANPTCESSGQEGTSYCSLQCDPGFIVPDTLYNTCVNPDQPGHGHCLGRNLSAWLLGCDVPKPSRPSTWRSCGEIDITEVTVAAYACYNNGEGPALARWRRHRLAV